MKCFLAAVIACILVVAVVDGASSKLGAWQKYKSQHGKVYNSLEEDSARSKLFEARLEMIENHNAREDKSFSMNVNHLSDLTHEEYKKMNGFRMKPHSNIFQANFDQLKEKLGFDDEPVPESVDWSKYPNIVSPVKNQGHCGSCWAFATIGLLEGQEHLNSTAKTVTQLSEQNLIDCDVDGNDHGCAGGDLFDPINFIKAEGGLDTERSYPYMSIQGDDTFDCLFNPEKTFETTKHIKEAQQLTQGDEELLKKVVAKYGPVAAAIDASLASFGSYQSGVYFDERCSSENLDHAILVVGYGTDEKHGDYWLIKNSWSENWGEKGYVKLARNRNNHCGIATAPTIAMVSRA